jgi:hypothetical protein
MRPQQQPVDDADRKRHGVVDAASREEREGLREFGVGAVELAEQLQA